MGNGRGLWLIAAAGVFFLAGPTAGAPAVAKPRPVTHFVNVRVVDGSGAPARPGAVTVRDGRILCVGDCPTPKGAQVVDGGGAVLAPGFIDTHSHYDTGLDADPDALAATAQGITTIVVGQDGESDLPLGAGLRRRSLHPAALNVASFVGHGSIRAAVMGADSKRPARPEEIARMARLVEAAMRDGALGLSTGLEYEPGLYATQDEVLTLAQAAARSGGRYISHMRSEDVRLDAAVDELLRIGRLTGMPVQISHFKIAMVDRWGQAPALLAKLEAARREGVQVSADVYPYDAWQSLLQVLLPERNYADLEAARFALDHLARPEDLRLSYYPKDPSLVGKTVAEIAAARAVAPERAYLDLIIEADGQAPAEGPPNAVIGRSMSESDVASLIAWRGSNISSDGLLVDRHPRGAGSFPKILRLYVRETGLLTLEQAVRKMSALAACHMGLSDRGLLAPGLAADLVLFDPARVADRATFADPEARPIGVDGVWVNGVQVVDQGRATGAHPGQVLRRRVSRPWPAAGKGALLCAS